MKKYTELELTEMNPITREVALKITIEGETAYPLWKHDLRIEAALALLETIDRHHFVERGKVEEFEEYIKNLKDSIEMIED